MRKETQKHGIPVASLHRRQSAAPPGSLRRHRRGNHRRLLPCRTCCNGQLVVKRLVQQSACGSASSVTRWRIARRVGRPLSKIAARKKGDPECSSKRRSDGINQSVRHLSFFTCAGPWTATLHRRRLLPPVPPTNKSKQLRHTSRLEMAISPTLLICAVFWPHRHMAMSLPVVVAPRQV